MAVGWLRWIPVVALLGGTVLTGVSWGVASDAADARYAEQFDAEADRIADAIDERFRANAQVLFGGLGLWRAEGDVNRTEWHDYVDALRLPSHYPGIQGIGYAQFVAAEDRIAHQNAIRSETPPDVPLIRPDLFSAYTIHDVTGAQHVADIYTSIIFLEPFDLRNQNAFGLDMYSHPERRLAMDAAIDTGEAQLSGKVTLVQEIDEDTQAGFLLYIPHYGPGPIDTIEQRQASIQGFVYSPLRAGDLIRGILGDASPQVTFQIFDGDIVEDAALLYDEGGATGDVDQLRRIEVAGRTWTIHFQNAADFVPATGASTAILVGGGIITLLIFSLVVVQSRTQHRAEELAKGMTEDLRSIDQEKSRLAADLARSNRELEQFAYIASHDLQEPLRTVSSFLELLEIESEDDLSDDAKQYIASARRGTTRMQQLIKDLLEYSRADAGTSTEVVDADACLDDALDEMASMIQEAGAAIRRDPLPRVHARSGELNRLFLNLLGNAVKYRSADRPLEVSISAKVDGTMARFTLEDNGSGIAEKDHEAVFALFKRLQRNDTIPGTGMGLAIVRRIVESCGGTIWVESVPQGTRFIWTLPVA